MNRLEWAQRAARGVATMSPQMTEAVRECAALVRDVAPALPQDVHTETALTILAWEHLRPADVVADEERRRA
jgi:hypothetical protein